jgi:hypothetical protein
MISNRLKYLIDFAIGDGHIAKYEGKFHYKLEHSTKASEYFYHKVGILKELGFTGLERTNERVLGGKVHHTISFVVHIDDDIRTAYKYVVNDGRKRIDKHLLKNLDARSLAYWYMDDGSANKSRYSTSSPCNGYRYYYEYPIPKVQCLSLYTYQFPLEEQELIQEWLLKNFDIHTTLVNSRGVGYYIKASKLEDKQTFVETVKPFIIPSMQYKIEGLFSYTGIKAINVHRKRLSEKAPQVVDEATVHSLVGTAEPAPQKN